MCINDVEQEFISGLFLAKRCVSTYLSIVMPCDCLIWMWKLVVLVGKSCSATPACIVWVGIQRSRSHG